MKRLFNYSATLLLLVFCFSNAQAQTLLLTEDFETDGEGTRYTSNSYASGTTCSDYFTRYQDGGPQCVTNDPTGENGTFYWMGEDLDDATGNPTCPGTCEGILTLNSISIAGFAPEVRVLCALGRATGDRFESTDGLIFEYNIDGGGWNICGAFYGPALGNGDLQQDTDLDGIADGPTLSGAFTEYIFPVPATGTNMQVRFRMTQNAGTEEAGVDFIRIFGNAACTDPDVPTVTATPAGPVCPGANVTLDWAGANLNSATNWHVYTTSCGTGQIAQQPGTSLVVNPLVTTTYFVRGEDGAGCVDESIGVCGSVTVTVSDAVPPSITCPGNQTGNVDATCNFSLPDYTGLATASDNCTASPTITQSPVPGTNVGVGTTVITLTADDGNGNTANCNFNVVVSDVTNPTITCPGNQTGTVDATCNFSLPDYTGLATPADNCPGVVVTQVPAPGTNVGVGTTNIVLTATDGSSNTANCNFDVVVSDATNPTITCPGNQTGTVDATCNFSLPDYTGLATANDNCPGVTVTQVPAPGTNVGPGTTNIVLTATDASSNTANCNFDVVVSDVTPPTITCPGNQTGTVDATCNFSLPDYTGLATPADNCPGVVVTQVPAPGTNVGVGTTNIVLTATDGGSNTANCNFDVVVSDATPPTITCPGNQTGTVDATCNFSLPDYTGLATANDNCPGVTVTQVPAPGTNVGPGTTNIVLTATDASSNTANCNFDVVVSDATPPTITCPGNQTGTVDASCNFTLPDYTGLATANDNCPGVVVTQVPAPGTNVGVGTTNIVLTATDGGSNTANCNFDVVVSDVTPPTITCPGNQVGSADASCMFSLPDYTGLATPADNCPGVVVTQVPAPGTMVALGTTNIVLTATDAGSNTANCNFDVVVSDNTPPTVTCPGDQTENPDASCNFTLPDYTGLVTAVDNCAGAPTVTQSPIPGTVISSNTTITMTGDDGNGNTANCTFDVLLNDLTPPTAVCQDITVYLDGAGNATITAADVDGGSTDNCGGVTLSATPTSFTCADIGTPAANDMIITGVIDGPLTGGTPKAVEFYVVNNIADLSQYGFGSANNGGGTDGEEFTFPAVAATAGQFIYVASEAPNFTSFMGFAPDYTDGSAPLINGDDAIELFFMGSVIDVFGDINVDGTGQPWEYLDGWAYRNDYTGPDGTTFQLANWTFSGINVLDGELTNASAAVPFPNGTYLGGGGAQVTLTVTDGNSNTDNCVANITVLDTVSPTATCPGNQLENFDASCQFTLPDYTGLVTAADNCTASPTVTQSPIPGTVISGNQTITMTVTDGSGNTSTCTFDVIPNDAIAPTITCPADQNDFYDGTCSFTLLDYTSLATATDNCGTPTVTQSPIPGTVVTANTTITLTADDGSGNTANCTFDVLLTDSTSPVATCPGDQNDFFDGTCSFTLPDYTGLVTATDNCNPAPTVTQSPIPGTVVTANTTITMTVDDGNGNTDVCTFDVLLTDNTAPTITCPANQNENLDASCQFTLPDYTSMATVADNCDPSPVVTQSPAAGTFISVNTTITLTATDASSNSSNCTFDVIVTDNLAPTAVCQNINAYVDGAGNVTIIAADIDGGSTDNCGAVTLSASPTAFTCADLGPNNVTLTVTDGNSNTDNCVAVVTVIDTVSPVATCPGNQLENFDASCQFTLPDYTGLVTAIDNCNPAPTVTQSPTPGTVISGNQTITMTADDGNGNTSTCTFDVIPNDAIAPTITCPADQNDFYDATCNFTLLDYTSLATAVDNCGTPTVTQSPIPGTVVSANTTITLTADDGAGNTANCTFDVLLSDSTAPAITCPGTQTENADAACMFSLADYTGLGTATDGCDPAPVITQNPPAGTMVGGGITQVWLIATDVSGNMDSCSFDVDVVDVTAPTFTCFSDDTVAADANCETMLADYASMLVVTDNCDPSPSVTQTPAPGTLVSGNGTVTAVTLTIMDATGNTATCNFNVLLADSTAPAITCPVDDTVSADASCQALLQDYTGMATVVDNCDASPTVTQNPAPGTTMTGSGTVTQVWLIATDADGNMDSCSFNVTLMDVTAPSIICPANDTMPVSANCDAIIADYTGMATAVDNCDPNPVITQSPAAGSTLTGSGNQTVWLFATDADGNVDSCTFDVVLTDSIAPAITCPADIVTCDTVVTFAAPTATDNCTVDSVVQIAGIPSGGTYPLGITTNTFVAYDGFGNTDTCSFTVDVQGGGGTQQANAGSDMTVCGTDSVTLNGNVPTGGNTGTWTALDGGTIIDPNDPMTLVTGVPVGTNSFVWTIGNGICQSSDTVVITIGAVPDATFTYVDNGTGVVVFTPNYQSGSATYLWEFDNLGVSSHMIDSILFPNPGNYVICLTVTENGCSDRYCETITLTTSMFEANAEAYFNVYPNPFRDLTNIAYEITEQSNVELVVMDISGREVATLMKGNQAPGEYQYRFESTHAAESGMYFIRLTIGDKSYVQRVIEMR